MAKKPFKESAFFRYTVRGLLLAIVSGSSAAALGQQSRPGEDTRRNTLEEVIVTVQRRAQSAQDVPLSLVSPSGEELSKAGVTDMRDLSTVVPGLTYTANSVFAQPNIRGISTSLTQIGAESPVAVYIDGFYQPNQIGNFFELPDVERIDVLKGPQGTLFGRNATGGAINVHTKSPEFEPGGKISVGDGMYFGGDAQSAHEFSAKGYVTGPIVDGVLAGSLSALYRTTDGYMTNSLNGDQVGKIDSHLVCAKLLYTPAEWARFNLAIMSSEHEDEAIGSLQPLNDLNLGSQYPGAVVPDDPWHTATELEGGTGYTKVEHDSISLEAELILGDWGTLTSLTGYTEVDGYLLQDVDATYSPNCLVVNACITPYLVDYGPTETFQQEVSFASEPVGFMSYVLGALYYEDEHNYGSAINPPLAPDGAVIDQQSGIFWSSAVADTEAWAVFGEITWELSERLSLITGLRYSWEEKSVTGSAFGGPEFGLADSPSWDAWTPRLSLLYAYSDQTNLYFTYSEGFKSGVIESVSLTGDVADPEEVQAYEVGLKTSTADYALNVAAYYYDYTDLQVQFFDGTVASLTNAATAEIYGLDVDSTINFSDNVRLKVSGSWIPGAEYEEFGGAVGFVEPMGPFGLQQISVDLSGDRLLRTARFTGSVSLDYVSDTPWGQLTTSGTYYYSSGYDLDSLGRVNTGAYNTLAGQLSLQAENSGLEYRLWGKNLTNEQYITTTTFAAQGDTGTYSAPRQVGVGVSYSF